MAENREERLEELAEDLAGFGTLNWERVFNEARELVLTKKEKENLAELLVGYIERELEKGQLCRLVDVEPVMKFFEVDGLEFTIDRLKTIMKFYNRFSLQFLYRMFPPLYDEAVRKENYDKRKYVRELLWKEDAENWEKTDEYIDTLWNLRKLLVRLYMQDIPKKLPDNRPMTLSRLVIYMVHGLD